MCLFEFSNVLSDVCIPLDSAQREKQGLAYRERAAVTGLRPGRATREHNQGMEPREQVSLLIAAGVATLGLHVGDVKIGVNKFLVHISNTVSASSGVYFW